MAVGAELGGSGLALISVSTGMKKHASEKLIEFLQKLIEFLKKLT
jgi:hypothetical protein